METEPDRDTSVAAETETAEVDSGTTFASDIPVMDVDDVIDDRELPEIFPDEVRALPLAELVWTYAPLSTVRTIDPSDGSTAAAMNELIIVRTVRRSGPSPVREVTALDRGGLERWSALVPRSTDPVGPAIDLEGATWIVGNEVRDELGPRKPFAYRISPTGDVLWEREVAGAEGDASVVDVGFRTSAIALDSSHNAYAVVGHSAVSITPLGDLRWARLLDGGPAEHRCEDVLPTYAPVVSSEHVFFAADCAVFVFKTDGTSVSVLEPWGGGDPALTANGWLTRWSGGAYGLIAVDGSGATKTTWPLAARQERVFGINNRLFAYSASGLTAWDGEISAWTYVGQNSGADAWLTDTSGRLLAVHGIYGEVAVVSPTGAVVFDGLVGRAIKDQAPVSAGPGEYVFRSRNFGEGMPWVLTCIRLPFAELPVTWATTNANYRNSRSVP